jgi:quinol monooxygenase YgiN
MKRIAFILTLIAMMIATIAACNKQAHTEAKDNMIVRIAEIEVYPQYLGEYLAAAAEIQQKSLVEEQGVVCLFPSQMKEDSCQIRILEIYASQEAYQHHIQTAHFQKYKQGTLHMVKSLKLNDLNPLAPETVNQIFKR